MNGHQVKVLLEWKGVDLPKKHDRGGQSALRFARQREEKRDWYLSRVEELTRLHFLDAERRLPTVTGLVLAGSADLKVPPLPLFSFSPL